MPKKLHVLRKVKKNIVTRSLSRDETQHLPWRNKTSANTYPLTAHFFYFSNAKCHKRSLMFTNQKQLFNLFVIWKVHSSEYYRNFTFQVCWWVYGQPFAGKCQGSWTFAKRHPDGEINEHFSHMDESTSIGKIKHSRLLLKWPAS